VEELVTVRVEDAALCPRYTARVVQGVRIGPSPDWLRSALEKVGVRSINNVVDVTNYVMLESGQPLHAFDLQRLAGPAGPDARPLVLVRRARDGEKFTTLDGVERTLSGQMLLIADAEKGIALAGVMGGQNTEIHERTCHVLIESAYFDPANIRRTSKALGLRTESSYRFERGADIGITEWASRRCAQLILQVAGGRLAAGVLDAYPNPQPPRAIRLRHHKVGELLGVPVPVEEQVRILERLGLRRRAEDGPAHVPLVAADPDTTTLLNKAASPPGAASSTTFLVPTWRVDLKRETDLIEEIERLYGVEKIPATPPRGALGTNPFDAVHDQIADVRRILCGLGLDEAQGQTLISEAAALRVAPAEALVRLANPLSSDMNTLRPSLLPGLLDSLRHNVTRKNADVALFEVGRVFRRREAGAPAELRRVAIALTGRRAPGFWSGAERGAKFDLFDLKGFIEEWLDQWGVRGLSWQRRDASTALFLESAAMQLGKQPLGELGQVQPALARQMDLRDAVFLAELDLDLLLARRAATRTFKPLPQFPSVRRDVALLVPETTSHEAVLQVIRQAKAPYLETVELFDVFRGGNVPEGRKSLAYALTYRSPERTLTDAEVNAAHATVLEALKTRLQATIRE
jgi:phenylalanyl-tRNA synthetase beta chain